MTRAARDTQTEDRDDDTEELFEGETVTHPDAIVGQPQPRRHDAIWLRMTYPTIRLPPKDRDDVLPALLRLADEDETRLDRAYQLAAAEGPPWASAVLAAWVEAGEPDPAEQVTEDERELIEARAIIANLGSDRVRRILDCPNLPPDDEGLADALRDCPGPLDRCRAEVRDAQR